MATQAQILDIVSTGSSNYNARIAYHFSKGVIRQRKGRRDTKPARSLQEKGLLSLRSIKMGFIQGERGYLGVFVDLEWWKYCGETPLPDLWVWYKDGKYLVTTGVSLGDAKANIKMDFVESSLS